MTYERLVEVNKELKKTYIQRINKEYVEVNQRVTAFRKIYPEGAIITDLISCENGMCIIKATVLDDKNNILSTGISYEKESASLVNKTSFIENCETSAVGRALGFLGIGIDTSICSADELSSALMSQPTDPAPSKEPVKYTPKNKKTPDNLEQLFKCESCGEQIVETKGKDGNTVTVDEIVKLSREKTGKTLCAACLKRNAK